MSSRAMETCPLLTSQPTEHIFQVSLYQFMKNDTLLVVYAQKLSAFYENSGVEFYPMVQNLTWSLPAVRLEIAVLNLTAKKFKTEVRADQNQSTEIDYVEKLCGGHTCPINVAKWLEKSAVSTAMPEASSVAGKGHTYGEAILNTDYVIAKGKTVEMEDAANKKIPKVPDKSLEIETCDFGNFKHSLIQGVYTEHSKSTGKFCLTAQQLWILLLFACYLSTTAAALSTSKSDIRTTVNVTVGEYFSISCGGVAQYDFTWRRYTENRREKLYASLGIKNYTNTSNIFFSNGTIIFPSAQLCDMANYHCIVVADPDPIEFEYCVIVQNLTLGSTEVGDNNVTSENISVSAYKGVTGIVVVVGVIVGAASVAGLSYFCRKRRKKRIERERRTQVSSNGHQSANGGDSFGNGIHHTPTADVETVVQCHECDTAAPLMGNNQSSV